ncbi:hypothetical protein LCGC14_2404430, partial [marine sediment metagenome]
MVMPSRGKLRLMVPALAAVVV